MKNIVGPEPAGERGGMDRYTKIMFGAGYIDGRPDPGARIDPDNPKVNSGNQKWPNRPQPFRSQPRSLALTPDGRSSMSHCPAGRLSRLAIAALDRAPSRVTKWLDLGPARPS